MRISDWSSDVCSSDLEYRKSLVEKGALYKHSIRFDIASYFNSIYHHDLAHWFESKTGVSAEDSAGFGKYCREINAGRSVDFLPQGIYPDRKSTRLNSSH